MTEPADEKRITLRLPTYLYEGITDAAKAKHMSINSYILQILSNDQYLADLEVRIAAVEREIAVLARERHRLQ